MTQRRGGGDHTHSYPARSRITEINPGMVFWNEPRQGWSFNVIVDGVAVRSLAVYPRHNIAKEAMRLEVDGIREMLAKTAAIVAAEMAEHHHLSGDDDNRRFAVGDDSDAQ
jgi:hypothetical protein